MKNDSKRKPVIIKGMGFQEMMRDLSEKSRLAEEEHKRNGGMCQNCGKDKAEYPNGLSPYNCRKCNEEALKLVQKLQRGGGFSVLHLGQERKK